MSEELRHKMLSWEAAPPTGAWETVSRYLQENRAEQQLAARLEETAVEPPNGYWNNIAAALASRTKPAPVFTIRPIATKLARYGAAAAVGGLLVWNFFLKKPPGQVSTAPSLSSMRPLPAPPAAPSASVATVGGRSINEFVQESTIEKEPLPPGTPAKRPLRYAVLHANLEANPVALPKPGLLAYHQPAGPTLLELPVQRRDLRYILIPAANGLPQRLSAKFASAVYRSITHSVQDAEQPTHQLLRDLEKKMLNNVFVPDPANLFDLVMFSQLIQEEQ